ncbi:MAG: OmpA family protein [Bacteroidota bacterium]
MKRFLSFILIFAIFCSATIAQELEPTATEVLLNVSLTDLKEKPITLDFIKIEGKTNNKSFYFKSPGSKFSLLIPKGETYTVKYRDFGGKEDTVELSIPDMEFLIIEYSFQYEPPKIYTLDNVFFDAGKSTLRPESYKELNELIEVMLFKNSMKIEIRGHTDNAGDEDANQKLSEDRANSVRNYLIKKGIEPDRVLAAGYGETQPVASNDMPEGRQKNRRTEVKILSN